MKQFAHKYQSFFLPVFVFIVAFILRIPFLSGSFWLDEAAQARESARPLSQQLMLRDDFQPPLLHLLIHFEFLLGRSEWWLRFGAAFIPGCATVLIVYLIGKKLANSTTGLIASLLLATSSFHIFFSQELRPYAFPAFCAVAGWLLLLSLIKPLKNQNRVLLWCSFVGISLCGIYSSYLYPFLLFAQFVALFFFLPKQRRQIFASGIAISFFFLPWLPSFLGQLSAGQALRTTLPGWQEVVSFNQAKSLLLIVGKFLYGVLDLNLSAAFFLPLIFLALSTSYLIWKNIKSMKKKPEAFLLFCFWLILPILSAWLISFAVPVLQPKRVLFCLPAFYLLLSYVLVFLPKQSNLKWQKWLGYGTVALLFCMNIFSTTSYWTQPKYQREDWRQVHELITSKYSSKSAIAVFAFPAPFAPWVWYDSEAFPTYSTEVLTTDSIKELPNAKKLTEYRFVLVFDYLRDLTDPKNKVLSTLTQYGFKEVDRITPQTPLGFVRVYSKSENILSQMK